MATAAPTCLDSGGHAAAWPVTRRYVFSGIWAADRVAANATAPYGREIAPETKIMYGVGTGVPGPFPDTAYFQVRRCQAHLGLAQQCRSQHGTAKAPPLAMVEGL